MTMSEYLILMSSSPRLPVDPPPEPLLARGARKHRARLQLARYVAAMSCTLRGWNLQVKRLRADNLTPGGASGVRAAVSRQRATIPSRRRGVATRGVHPRMGRAHRGQRTRASANGL